MSILEGMNYKQFNCIADKCKDSCCIGWKVSIDKSTYNKYKKVKGDISNVLAENIARDRSNNSENAYGKMKLDNMGRCGFLDENNLCLVHGNLGEDYLCNTCKSYPRKIKKHGELYERNLTLSCPVVAKSLIENDVFTFTIDEGNITKLEEKYVDNKVYNKELYCLLFEARNFTIEIAQFREIELWKRLTFIMLFNEKLQEVINTGEYYRGLTLIENYREYCCDEENINALDSIKKVNRVNLFFINSILENKVKTGISNKTFISLMEDFNKLAEDKTIDELTEVLNEVEETLSEGLKKYNYVLENYLVYNIYDNYLNALNTKDVKKEVVRMALSYSIIKRFLITRAEKKSCVIGDEDLVDVLYSFSRVLEHSDVFIEKLYKGIKEGGYDTSAYLTVLIR